MSNQELILKSSDLFYVGETHCDSVRSQAAGLYYRDTRYLKVFDLLLDGQPPEILATSAHSARSATITAANPALSSVRGEVSPHTIAIEQHLRLDSALRLLVILQNYGSVPAHFDLEMRFSADFRDVFEIRGMPREQHGTVLPPDIREGEVLLRCRTFDEAVLATRITFDRKPRIHLGHRSIGTEERDEPAPSEGDAAAAAPTAGDPEGVRITFPVSLDPGMRWELHTDITPDRHDGRRHVPVSDLGGPALEQVTIVTDNPFFDRLLERSQDDLAALMSRFPDGTLPAAGIPWFVAPFGRDSLITALQTIHIAPQIAKGTLRVLASLQGTKVDPFTEEEPGKILHEMRYGEMMRSGEIPHRPYFATADATPLFILLFAETVAWTADGILYRDLLPNVLAALEWVEKYGDTDGDGMIEYDADPISGIRIRHRVWKDSLDSLHHLDGREPQGRVTPVEVQGYLYAAYRSLQKVAAMYGDEELVRQLEPKARSLRDTFERDFWMEEYGYYAQALDGDRSQMQGITSNAGHLLGTGIASPERASAVAHRLRQSDMQSGWGIRTLSALSVNYNPMSYHNGSVWPHDNSLIAFGCYFIGEHEIGNEIFTAMFDLCRMSANERLNELYCGFSRSDADADEPVPYPAACSPQAWAAGTLPFILRGALGLQADVENRVLRVDPHLPTFISEVEIRDLSVAGHTGRLRVRRNGGRYIVEGDGLPIHA